MTESWPIAILKTNATYTTSNEEGAGKPIAVTEMEVVHTTLTAGSPSPELASSKPESHPQTLSLISLHKSPHPSCQLQLPPIESNPIGYIALNLKAQLHLAQHTRSQNHFFKEEQVRSSLSRSNLKLHLQPRISEQGLMVVS